MNEKQKDETPTVAACPPLSAELAATHKFEWRNPWFGGDGWTPCKAETLEGAARELPMPYHEETTLREVATGQVFRRS